MLMKFCYRVYAGLCAEFMWGSTCNRPNGLQGGSASKLIVEA